MPVKKDRLSTGLVALITLIGFILLFTYLSLNLTTIDSGYEQQGLMEQEVQLKEEISRLKSEKAKLLNLERVERVVTEELGYSYPDPGQFIKVYDDEYEDQP